MFQSFWYGDALSPYEEACIRSFLDHGHRFALYTYEKGLRVPDGVERRDAAALVPFDEYFTYGPGVGEGSPALFANLFRYKLLAENGGWWVDTDVVCLSRAVPDSEIYCAYQETGSVNNAVLRLPKGHPIAIEGHRKAQAIRDRARWGETGPELLSALIDAHGLGGRVHPMPACYPVHYTEAIDLLRPSRAHVLRERVRDATFLHLWNEMFRREDVDKTKRPPPGSLLREIFDRHGGQGWTGEYPADAFETPRQVRELEAAIRALEAERDRLVGELRRELAALRDSWSWRVTSPLRWFGSSGRRRQRNDASE
jgi:hypothetical protein